MKTLKTFPDYFIVNESRAQIIEPKGISFNPYKNVIKHPKEILEKYAPWYNPVQVETPLFRNVNRTNYDEYLLLDPSENNRKYVKGTYASTRNYVNMIVDFNWTGYPNRTNAIIGLTNQGRLAYGDMKYRVIPIKKNSRVGIAPTQDFWFSFNLSEAANELLGDKRSSGLATYGTKDIEKLIYMNLKLEKNYNKKSDLIKDLNSENRLKRIDSDLNILKNLKDIEDRYGSIYNFLLKYINPDNSTYKKPYVFESVKYNMKTKVNGMREFWTTAPCLMIKEEWEGYGQLNDVYLNGF